MQVNKNAYLLSVLITHTRDSELSLGYHAKIREVCERICDTITDEDLQLLFLANPDVIQKASIEFDDIINFVNKL